MPETIVIIGAGQSAAVAARTLRRRKHQGSIVLVGDEKYHPYQRPPLSKEFLAGEQEEADTYLLDQEWCSANDVELHLGARAARIDATDGYVELDDGNRVSGDTFLVATGSRARRIPGVEGDRVFYLRDLDDATQLRDRLRPGGRVITVGAGFIGSEVASVARSVGAEVVTLEALEAPLERILGRRLGEACGQIQRSNGIDLRTQEIVETVTNTDSGVSVRTQRGTIVEGDVIVVGTGTLPNTEVAEASGIAVNQGVLVDEYCRTNVPGVFAAGDVTNHWHPLFGCRMRVEHYDNATKQAMAAAKNILGRETVFNDPHWFWSDQFGLNLQHAGYADKWDELVVRGSVENLDFIAFYLSQGVVRAAFSVERGGDMFVAKELIGTQATPEPASLANEDVELAELMAS